MSYCNKCGAQNPEGSRFCNSCGASLESGSKKHRSKNGYNLAVDYMTINPDVYMRISFLDWKNVVAVMNNETKLFNLQPGIHGAIIQIGNKAYRRNITISPGSTVNIHCAWDGRARINIEQPFNYT